MKGKVIIFTAPSGSGKSTIVKEILNDRIFRLSISSTTRNARDYEVDGIHYNFLSLNAFKEGIENEDFIEFEEVYENQFYGTPKKSISKIWEENKTVLFDVDVKGALKLKKYFGDNALSVFIKVPSIETLKERLYSRGTETEDSLNKRISKFEEELNYIDKFDYILINDNLKDSIKDIRCKIGNWL